MNQINNRHGRQGQFRQSRLAIASTKAKEVQAKAQIRPIAPHLLLPDRAKTLFKNDNFVINI